MNEKREMVFYTLIRNINDLLSHNLTKKDFYLSVLKLMLKCNKDEKRMIDAVIYSDAKAIREINDVDIAWEKQKIRKA